MTGNALQRHSRPGTSHEMTWRYPVRHYRLIGARQADRQGWSPTPRFGREYG
jgi:hypothetical protein